MIRRPSAFMPLGRLHDPLQQLATRVHGALVKRRQVVWIDDRGSVFMHDADLLGAVAPRSIIGTYDIRTPRLMIEGDLRLALRERACAWITDWNAQPPCAPRRVRHKILQPRPRRIAARSADAFECVADNA